MDQLLKTTPLLNHPDFGGATSWRFAVNTSIAHTDAKMGTIGHECRCLSMMRLQIIPYPQYVTLKVQILKPSSHLNYVPMDDELVSTLSFAMKTNWPHKGHERGGVGGGTFTSLKRGVAFGAMFPEIINVIRSNANTCRCWRSSYRSSYLRRSHLRLIK